MSVNQELRDRVLRHELDVRKFGNFHARMMVQQLEVLEKSLAKQIEQRLGWIAQKGYDSSKFTMKRLEANLAETRAMISQGYKELGKAHKEALTELAKGEAGWASEVVAKELAPFGGVSLGIGVAEGALLKHIVTKEPLIGGLMSEWTDKLSSDAYTAFRSEIRTGMLAGESIPEIQKRLFGSVHGKEAFKGGTMAIRKRHAESWARTSVSKVAGSAREATWQANKDTIKAIEWVSTLDNRTTPECMIRDGLLYTLQYEPIGHKVPWDGGPGGLHWNCRSASVPVLPSWEEMGIEAGELSGEQRASMDGKVPAKEKFGDWMGRLKKNGQTDRIVDILGKTRATKFINGDLDFQDFFSDKGQMLTLAQLQGVAPGSAKAAAMAAKFAAGKAQFLAKQAEQTAAKQAGKAAEQAAKQAAKQQAAIQKAEKAAAEAAFKKAAEDAKAAFEAAEKAALKAAEDAAAKLAAETAAKEAALKAAFDAKQAKLAAEFAAKQAQQAADFAAEQAKEAAEQAAKAKAQKTAQTAVNKAKKQQHPVEILDGKGWTKTGGQGGSNPGAMYTDASGQKWYVKFNKQGQGLEQLTEEITANRLYRRAGINVPEVHFVDVGGQRGLASRIIDGQTSGTGQLGTLGAEASVKNGFVTDAWLGNWDVAGASGDNLLVAKNGSGVWRIDVGGSLRYRAQGKLKSGWNSVVNELQSLRNAGTNYNTSQLFGSVTELDIVQQIKHLNNTFTDAALMDVLNSIPGLADKHKLFDLLKDRRNWLLNEVQNLQAAAKAAKLAAEAAAKAAKLAAKNAPKLAAQAAKLAAKFKEWIYEHEGVAWANKQWSNWTSSLTSMEKSAIKSYTGSGYSSYNGHLRSQMRGVTASDGHELQAMDRALQRSVMPEDVVIFRGTNMFSDLEKFIKKGTPGSTLDEYGFTSSRLGRHGYASGSEVQLEIHVHKGTKGVAWVDTFSRHTGEREFIFKSHTKFRLLAPPEKKGFQWFLKVEVIA